jgi:hypothetical protein
MVGIALRAMWPDVKSYPREPRVEVRQRSVKVVHRWRLRKDDVVAPVAIPALDVNRAKPDVTANVDDEQHDCGDQ